MVNMDLDMNDLEVELTEKFSEYVGFKFEEISNKVNVNPDLVSPKASIVTIVNKMLMSKNIDKKELVKEVNPKKLSIKTVRLQPNGTPRESMSFEKVNFEDIVHENWESSKLRNKFADTIFLFMVFQYQQTTDVRQLLFKGIKVWQMSKVTLDNDVRGMWESTREIVSNGVELNEKLIGNKIVIENNLPGKPDNDVAHIRPKASDGNDKIELPDGQMITKQAYWLNNSYIGSILEDLPDVIKRDSANNVNRIKLSWKEINLIKAKLVEPVYPVEEFVIKAKQVNPSFTELDVKKEIISKVGYQMDNRFVIEKQLVSIDEYLYGIIFNDSYFQIPKKPIFQTPYVKRKIDNYENDFKLLKVEEENGLYITNKSLLNGGITKQDLIHYKKSVEGFVGEGEFFSLHSIAKNNFYHELEEYGFEDIFYESILMRPGKLKYLKIAEQNVFVKTKKEVTIHDFISILFGNDKSINVDDLIGRIHSVIHISINYNSAVKLMKNTEYYYSHELHKLYKNKENYFQDIYN